MAKGDKYLCIGGAADGKWCEMNIRDGMVCDVFPKTPSYVVEASDLDPTCPLPDQHKYYASEYHYIDPKNRKKIHDLNRDDYTQKVKILIKDGMTPFDAIMRLIDNYSPR